jgi:hypothetical protein
MFRAKNAKVAKKKFFSELGVLGVLGARQIRKQRSSIRKNLRERREFSTLVVRKTRKQTEIPGVKFVYFVPFVVAFSDSFFLLGAFAGDIPPDRFRFNFVYNGRIQRIGSAP